MNPLFTRTCESCAHIEVAPGAEPCATCVSGVGFPGWTPAVERRVDAHQRLLDDQKRLEWLFPVLTKLDDPTGIGGPRTAALGAALMLGKTGRDALDYAMEGSP